MVARLVVLLVAAFALLVATPAAQAQEYVLKVASAAPADGPFGELFKRFKKQVEKASGGRIKVKLYLGGMLGGENEMALKLKRGEIECAGLSTGALASQVPEISVLELPFLFRSEAEADHAIDKAFTPAIEPVLKKYGFVLGFWAENGFRHFGTKDRFVKAPSDLKGKKMRAQEAPVHLQMWKALGAAPVPIPTTETFTALQSGTVDGFDQALVMAIATSWTKTVKYLTLSSHIYQPAIMVYNKAWFDKLPPDLQKILTEDMRPISPKARRVIRKIAPDLVEVAQSQGMQVHALSPAERAVFEKASKPVRVWFRKTQGKQGAKLLDVIEKSLSQYRKGK